MSQISSATVGRLVGYLRVIGRLQSLAVAETSSRQLAEAAQVTAVQVRKDLARLKIFGRRGAGYDVEDLDRKIRAILGLDRPWNVAIVGMGRLGQALAHYPAFNSYDFKVLAYFDTDSNKVGSEIAGIEVAHMDDAAVIVSRLKLDIAFLTVPQEAAQQAADRLVAAGIRGIMNFAPTAIAVPPRVRVEPVDFLAGLKKLSFYIQEQVTKEDT